MTLVLFIGIFGQLLGGKLADRYREEIVYTVVFLVSAPLLFLVGRLHGGATVACAMVFAFFYFTNQSVGNTIIPRFVPEARRGHIYGWFFLVNFSGGSIMSWIAGVVAVRFSLSSIFVLLSAVLFAAGITGFFLIAASRSTKEQKV
jgi:MFS family permease